jgi:hypothetical protein
MLTAALCHPHNVWLRTGSINMIADGMTVVPAPIISSGREFYQTFAQYMHGRVPTTPEKANTGASGGATFAGIVTRGGS